MMCWLAEVVVEGRMVEEVDVSLRPRKSAS